MKRYRLVKEATVHKFTDQEFDPVTRTLSSKVIYLPNFEKGFKDLRTARETLKVISRSKHTKGDSKLDEITEKLNRIFNEFRTHLRKNYYEEYEKVKDINENRIELLVRKKLKEISATGTESFFSPGEGAQYATPYAFTRGKKAPRSNSNIYRKLGYKLANKKR